MCQESMYKEDKDCNKEHVLNHSQNALPRRARISHKKSLVFAPVKITDFSQANFLSLLDIEIKNKIKIIIANVIKILFWELF